MTATAVKALLGHVNTQGSLHEQGQWLSTWNLSYSSE